jgi:hypothetical protein
VLRYQDLRWGSISLLAELTGYYPSQFSAWINQPDAQMSIATLDHISEMTGVPFDEVRRAFRERRQQAQLEQKVNRRLRNALKKTTRKVAV